MDNTGKVEQMEQEKSNQQAVKIERFRYSEKIWNRVTLFLFTLACFFFVLGYIAVRAILVIPQYLQDIAEVLFYVYLGYTVFMIGRVFKFFFFIRPLGEKVRIGKSLRSIILSPVAIVILYLGMLMMALTSCSG